MKKIDTLLFDLDGTILNTSGDLSNAVNYALEKSGYSKKSKKEIESYLGNGIEQLIRLSLPDDLKNLDNIVKKTLANFKNYYSDNISVETTAYNGMISLLDHFKNAGFKIGIVSNKFDEGLQKLCKDFKLYNYAQCTIGEKKGMKRKPAPDMISYVLENMKSAPEKSIYIGDSEVDILTSHNVNIKCICVSWGFRDANFLKNNKADYIANKPEDIIYIIDNLNS